MNKKQLIIMGLVLALSLPLNVWAATTLGDDLTVGDGTPDVTQDGEDAYIEGTLEVDGAARFDGVVTFVSTDGTDGPVEVLYHDDATPANSDGLGGFIFRGKDSGDNDTDYATIAGYIKTVTADSEEGGLAYYLAQSADGGSYLSGIMQPDNGESSIRFALGDPTSSGYVDAIYTSFGATKIGAASNNNVTLSASGTGAVLIDGAFATTYTSVTGPGAIDVNTRTTTIATTGADAYTLADGVEDGQKIDVVCVNHVGDGTLTPTTTLGFTSVTFDGAGQSVSLMWFEGLGWAVINNNGATLS